MIAYDVPSFLLSTLISQATVVVLRVSGLCYPYCTSTYLLYGMMPSNKGQRAMIWRDVEVGVSGAAPPAEDKKKQEHLTPSTGISTRRAGGVGTNARRVPADPSRCPGQKTWLKVSLPYLTSLPSTGV
jgi:hypothetical protein